MRRRSEAYRTALGIVPALLVLVGVLLAPPALAGEQLPKLDSVEVEVFPGYVAAAQALQRGEVDLSDGLFSPGEIAEAEEAGVTVLAVDWFNYLALDLNNQRWPTSDRAFRRALAHLLDKDAFVGDVEETGLLRIDHAGTGYQHCEQDSGWCHPGVHESPYNPDPEKAAEILTEAGYFQKEEIWHGPEGDEIDLDLLITFPDARKDLSEMYAGALRDFGIPVQVDETKGLEDFFLRVLSVREFHVVTSGWLTGPFPSLSLYHSDNWAPEGFPAFNYAGVLDDRYDEAVDRYLEAETIEKAQPHARTAQRIAHDEAFTLPVYSIRVNQGHAEDLDGVVNATGTGVTNRFTYLGAERAGSTARVGLAGPISDPPNPATAATASETHLFDMLYDALTVSDPEDPQSVSPRPILASEVAVDGDTITYTLREGATWHDGEPITAQDVAFTVAFLQSGTPPRLTSIEEVEVLDEKTARVMFPSASFLNVQALANTRILPEHIWEKVSEVPDPALTDEHLIGSGPFELVGRQGAEWFQLERNEDYYLDESDLDELLGR